MMRLKDRHRSPPDGFWIVLPQFNINRQFWSFKEAGDFVEEMARANPRLKMPSDRRTIDNLVDIQNSIRVSRIPGASEIYLIDDSKGGQAFSEIKKAFPPRPVVSVVEKIKQLNSGAELLKEWKSQGYYLIPKIESNRRASVCAECPKNSSGDLSSWFTVPASEHIKKSIEGMNQENVKTDYDEKLGVCEACLCPLKLKVHTPLPLILKHLTQQSKSELHSNCWIIK